MKESCQCQILAFLVFNLDHESAMISRFKLSKISLEQAASINESSRASFMVDRRYVFTSFNLLKLRSLLATDTGIVNANW